MVRICQSQIDSMSLCFFYYYTTDEHLITFLGSHRRVGRRGSACGLKEVDNSLSLLEGKSSKRGSTSYSLHERQVWVQKAGSSS
ncbi:hypothetical protein BHE74_00009802 [Ensete ventricosum]|nr:hypothetical protein GW17_00032119 [Ensete ventricosum]RWW81786.1 hypothetical protein BHE74_00009802 [Ensete ventricosum]RZR80047.1 hypothetical protein BHM03_00005949 [Ensete ventricosum]